MEIRVCRKTRSMENGACRMKHAAGEMRGKACAM